jgi:hypothetical protein
MFDEISQRYPSTFTRSHHATSIVLPVHGVQTDTKALNVSLIVQNFKKSCTSELASMVQQSRDSFANQLRPQIQWPSHIISICIMGKRSDLEQPKSSFTYVFPTRNLRHSKRFVEVARTNIGAVRIARFSFLATVNHYCNCVSSLLRQS